MSRFFQRKAYNREDANSWERLFGKLLTPVEAFTRNSSASGILLIVCTLAALAIANSPWRDAYFHLLHQPVAVSFGEWRLEMSLHHCRRRCCRLLRRSAAWLRPRWFMARLMRAVSALPVGGFRWRPILLLPSRC